MNVEDLKASGFKNAGILVVHIDDHRLDDFERQFLKNIGNRIFGAHAQ